MRVIRTRSTRWSPVWTVLAIVALLLLFMLPAAMAQTACGEAGTGKTADGRTVTRTAEEAAGTRVKEDGYWWTCNAARPLLIQPPADCVPQTQGFRKWTTDGHTCTTARKYASSPNDPARDRVIKHGRVDYWQQWTGPMRGRLIERCTDGVRTVAGSSCAPVTHCDNKWSTSNDGGKTVYSYDARHPTKHVPVGEYVEATTADGKTLRIQCVAGDFQAAPRPTPPRKAK